MIPETESDKQRYEEAIKRRKNRLRLAKPHRHRQQACIVRPEKLK